MRAGEARERAPLLGPVLRPFPWSGGQPCVLGSRHQPREPLPVLGWSGDLGRAVLGTGVRCEGGVFVSASICPRPHQVRALGAELDSSWGHNVNSEGHMPGPFLIAVCDDIDLCKRWLNERLHSCSGKCSATVDAIWVNYNANRYSVPARPVL